MVGLLLFLYLPPGFKLFEAGGLFLVSENFSETINIALLGRTVFLCGITTLISLFLGGLLAFLFSRTDLPGRTLYLAFFLLPGMVPSSIHALSWSRLISNDSVLVSLVSSLGLTTAPLTGLSGIFATIWVLAISYYPIALLLITVGFINWDYRNHEAALLHGRPVRAHVMIQGRYFLLYLLAAGLLVFLLTFSDFAVADLFQTNVYATEIFIQLAAYQNTQKALAVSLPPLILALVMMIALVRLVRRIPLAATDGRRKMAPTLSLNKMKWLIFSLVIGLAFLLVILPTSQLIFMTKGFEVIQRAFVAVWQDLLTGAIIAILVTLFMVVLAFFLAYCCHRRIRPAGQWVHVMSVAAFALPSSLLGLAMILFWNQAGWRGWWYSSGMVLFLAFAGRWFPLLFEMVSAGWRQVSPAQEEAAFACSGSWWRSMYRVLLSQMRPGLVGASLLGFIFCFNELNLAVLLAPPGVSTLPLRIFSTVHYGPDSLLAAMCLLQVAFLLLPTMGALWFLRSIWKRKMEPNHA